MFQNFHDTASPQQGPPRLAQLREEMVKDGLGGFMIPRADAHQGEYVAACDERLAYLTGFTGSAGFCIALADIAGIFIDGRYTVQVKMQVDEDHFTPVDWPENLPADWLRSQMPNGGVLGYDPLHYTPSQIKAIEKGLESSAISLKPHDNLIDRIWTDQPAPPQGKVSVYPDEFAGDSHEDKRARLATDLKTAGQESAILTLPDSIAWLLNIRGCDIPRNPVAHAFAILHDTGHLTLFIEDAKLDDTVKTHLGADITIRPPHAFGPALRSLTGPVRLDDTSAPLWIVQELEASEVPYAFAPDPCVLPKACKTEAEINATRTAHLRDGAAVCEFLCWFDAQPPDTISEIDVVTKIEGCRAATGKLLDISFDTIAGTGPHGAMSHYRVSHSSNRTLQDGELLVLDGGGQYLDGTTDITRTLPVGKVGDDEKQAFTRVLQGMIAISRLRFPVGLAGRDLDAIARYPLWLVDQDYNHGTGHGVGVHLCVHEGPQRLSKVSHVPFEPGMIVSNEPGYYREGAFGIRIENLVVVTAADLLPGGDQTGKLCFETLNFVPIDKRLIKVEMLSGPERDWLNAYHRTCRDKITPLLDQETQLWLEQATQPV
ncbi:aminopeptidase P family protein [Roseovarius sp. EL26]|uniref:aminopeptidase P family protein n=1 Tax=Roseovarius sp. EL26 TaxID=2126672 RepID=UPI000EA1A849|nr:aminopeptidase P family protein [Roseovarius sp. EL26]